MNLAKVLWVIASLYLLVVGFIYIIILKDAPSEGLARFEYIQDNWGIYDHQWKAEFLIAVCLAISSLIFGSLIKNQGFQIIGVGQILIAVAFPISLGITPSADYELYSVMSTASHRLVNFGMLISLCGFLRFYWEVTILKKWLRITAIIASTLGLLSFGASFFEIISQTEAQKTMLLVIILYLINAYYGVKVNETITEN